MGRCWEVDHRLGGQTPDDLYVRCLELDLVDLDEIRCRILLLDGVDLTVDCDERHLDGYRAGTCTDIVYYGIFGQLQLRDGQCPDLALGHRGIPSRELLIGDDDSIRCNRGGVLDEGDAELSETLVQHIFGSPREYPLGVVSEILAYRYSDIHLVIDELLGHGMHRVLL